MTAIATTSSAARRNAANRIGAGALAAIDADPSDDVAALTLNGRGMIEHCNRAAESLFDYRCSELRRQHVSSLLPQLAQMELTQNGELNPRLRFLLHIGRNFEAVARTGERFAAELFINVLDNSGPGRLSLIVKSGEAGEQAGAERAGWD